MSKKRGFEKLKGVTIGKIKVDAINEVVLFDETGEHFYVIEAEPAGPYGLPIISLSKYKNNKQAAVIPEKKLATLARAQEKAAKKQPQKKKDAPGLWPFPSEDNTLD